MSSIATMGYSLCAVLLIHISFVSCELSILDPDTFLDPDTSPECKYVSISPESGWWWNKSAAVETFRGRDNVYYGSYPYVRAECVSIFPESALRLRTFLSASLPAGIIGLISCGAVGVVFAFIAIIIFIVVLRRRRLEQARIAQMRTNSSVHFSQTPLLVSWSWLCLPFWNLAMKRCLPARVLRIHDRRNDTIVGLTHVSVAVTCFWVARVRLFALNHAKRTLAALGMLDGLAWVDVKAAATCIWQCID